MPTQGYTPQGLTKGKSTVLGDGLKTVTVAGTAERLSGTSRPVDAVWILPKVGNTDISFIGGSTVASTRGFRFAVEAVTRPIEPLYIEGPIDLYNIWVDVAVGGEGVTYMWIRRAVKIKGK